MSLINITPGGCELAELRPYPSVTSVDSSITVTPVVGPDGKTTYNIQNECKSPVSYYKATSPSENILNADFELGTGLPSPGNFSVRPDSDIVGWQSSTGQIEVWSDGFLGVPAHSGDYFVEMNASSPGRLYQTLVTPETAGVLYYSVWHRQRGGAPGTETAEVIVAVDGVDNVMQVMNQSNTSEWTNYSGSYEKPCGVTEVEIAFNALTPGGSNGNFLDLVELSYEGFGAECSQGWIGCDGVLYDELDQVVPEGSYSFCDPACPIEPGTSESQVIALIEASRQELTVDSTSDATFSLDPVDIHNNGSVVLLQDGVLDAGWSRAANTVTYTGTPDKVIGYISVNAPDAGASNYWSRPKLRVLSGVNTIAVIDDLVMQQNGAYDGDATLNGVFFDKQPGANPSYTFEWFDQDNRTSTLPPNSFSQIALSATTKVTVFAP